MAPYHLRKNRVFGNPYAVTKNKRATGMRAACFSACQADSPRPVFLNKTCVEYGYLTYALTKKCDLNWYAATQNYSMVLSFHLHSLLLIVVKMRRQDKLRESSIFDNREETENLKSSTGIGSASNLSSRQKCGWMVSS